MDEAADRHGEIHKGKIVVSLKIVSTIGNSIEH